jgi:hypothetical protein
MTSRTSLKISSRKHDEKLTPDQERFRYLLAQIEKARKTRAKWEKAIQDFRRSEQAKLQPLRMSLKNTLRETVFELGRVLERQKWARIDRDALEEILRSTAQMILEAKPDDAEVKAVFDRHSPTTFEESKREELQRLKAEAERSMGIDLGDEGDILTEDDLAQRMYEHMDKERRDKEERSSRRRKSPAQERVETSAQSAKQSIREMYRKLASAVHPDREPDAKKRAEKNELMQTINRAYATNDLLTLLEAQMQLEQIDPDHIAKLSGKRLAHYNKVLAEQLTSERKAVQDIETGFRMDYRLEGEGSIELKNLGRIIRESGRGIRQEIERQKQFLEVLRTATATKRWLKTQRRFARAFDDEDDEEF